MSQTLGENQTTRTASETRPARPDQARWETRPPAERSAARARAEDWLAEFEAALAAGDADRAAGLFATTSFWRDLVAFTWNLKTVEDRDGVADLVRATAETTDARGFHLTAEPTEADGVVEAWLGFETAAGRGKGHLRLVDEGAWTLLTTLHELTGHEEPSGHRRPKGAEHGVDPDRTTWQEARDAEAAELGRTRQPYVVVVGGGQGGIALGARLRQLGVPHVVLDAHARPGDQWRGRYKSLCLHDPVWYDHLPYLDFPRNWPVFAPKDKIADWLEMYTKVMEINYWSSSTCRSASYDERTGEWTVLVDRDGERIELRPRQLVLATGVSGKPNVPEFPGQDRFRGEQHHSSRHPGPDAYRGKRAVVIGSNNSAFDICGALWEVGADVTMVQRSSTHISKSDSLMELSLAPLYSEEAVEAGITTQQADLVFASQPYRIMDRFQRPACDAMRERDADFYARLEAAGFRHDFGDDDSGLFMKYLRRGSGYYIDVGAAELVADGRVALAHGQVAELTEDAVLLADGTELPADLVVYATGYGSMNGWAADLISQEVADKVGKVWGLGSDTTKDPGPWEGEQRNMWKPTQQEALWFHGGNLHQSRHYSLYLALQLKARAEGIPTPVYGLQEVHHTR
ncbi:MULTISPECIES: NAD(P)/FAD-dependent oxidoreductase [unclassified Saccharopolyspora]|uniref:flavin-containing monooxygenase n=1 Tax=unclassified Saccharopolyspora TaxID=2646250 RepID=UPI001CD3D2CF|nr:MULTISPECIES: NAD(P)/FAD-dependent oxidoreductase [unclassified Saccharopolyspora]MCA1190272.1 NAD(P)/FAD-dependent oxidoreductase [Saccharopolyspora sp. 6T]MCA1196280.1 NAD(P)/FAD-dependent oxidoreductase [Saccharopolyspora sp. 6V]MCA1229886.1 NAD(P)/FAD-dependent oxidoreductase [Saccharopolyspora sp. 6M]MCA1281564.1 NAD(P)/FAD-dependent oxidoreductase [Saccharopolyspora sp. 7B]